MNKKRILIFASGRGSNAEAIHEAVMDGRINGEVVGVICDHKGAQVLERAARWHVPSVVIEKKDYPDKAAFDEALLRAAVSFTPDLICLAGYMRICGENLVNAFPHRIINIHPSLIPSFCGKGYYGLTVHEKALKRGVKVTGATVHFVDEVLDNGPIILQKAVMIEEGDTPEVLQRRVMEQAEWVILPKAIDLIANGKISVENGIAHIKE